MSKKIILVTGASSGIGRDVAIKLAKQGHEVYGGARRIDKLKELEKFGVHPMNLDVTDTESAKHVVDSILSKHHRIDILFNNAGFGLYGAIETIPLDKVREQFEVNVFGLANMIKLVLPSMRLNKKGTIINTSSVGGKISTPLASWYHASKFAVEGLSDTLRLELKEFNIDVVLIEPGLIATNFYDIAIHQIRKYSLNSPYRDISRRVIYNLGKVGGGKGFIKGSKPDVVTRAVVSAVNSKKPRTRYLVGGGAKTSLFVKNIVSSKSYDSLILSQMAGKIQS